MRIFLSGATGYIGSSVLDALVRAGHTVTALVRDITLAVANLDHRPVVDGPRTDPNSPCRQ